MLAALAPPVAASTSAGRMAKQALRLLRVELDEDSATGEYDVHKLLDLVLAGHVPIDQHVSIEKHENVVRALEWAQVDAAAVSYTHLTLPTILLV